MDNTASSAYAWALHEMGFSDFNDLRLTQRAVKIIATFLQHPHQSIPAGCNSWKDTKATYRFFDNDKVNSGGMLSSHQDETINRCLPFQTILVAQDTTTINLTNKQVSGLGRIGEGTLQGFFTHSALAMNPYGVPLGILYQKTYVRKEGTQDKEYKKRYKQIPIEDKETVRWVETIDSASQQLKDKQVVVIGDRESDIFDVFKAEHKAGVDLLIRTAWNRLVEDPNSQNLGYLFDKAKNGAVITTYQTKVPIQDEHKNSSHKTRIATLTVKACKFLLRPPRHKRKQVSAVPLFLLDVSEENPPASEEGIHWMLTTTIKVTTPEEVIEKVTWYMYRWRIERFHYILKTGAFNVEKLQFETFPRFKKAITLYSIVAWRILWTTYEAREHPDDDAKTIFSEEELKVLKFREGWVDETITIQEAVTACAKLGGYLGRKNDGPPGVKTLWIGFQKLQDIVYGMMLTQQN